MRQVAGLIPTYSSDEFGICSALYELGGMVVMHDASGCNSTYTTHDEPRWYDMESMIYISAISEMEAIMGDDEKFINDLIETAGELHPKFIAIVGAPIPYMIGTDFKAIASIVEAETGIPCMGFEANGMHDYTRGVSWALAEVVERFCVRNVSKSEEFSVNIIGATPLDFSLNGSIDSIRTWLSDAGIKVNCCMAMGSNLEEILLAGRAHANLVISSSGMAAAKKLSRLFGMKNVAGIPMGEKFAKELMDEILKVRDGESVGGLFLKKPMQSELRESDCWADISEQKLNINSRSGSVEKKNKKLLIIGDALYSASVAAALRLEFDGADVGELTVACPLEKQETTAASWLKNLGIQIVDAPEEDDLIAFIETSDVVMADPFYKVLCDRSGKEIEFIGLPHEAFSGRIYDAVNPNLVGHGFKQYFGKNFR